jgi:hypothetical protein
VTPSPGAYGLSRMATPRAPSAAGRAHPGASQPPRYRQRFRGVQRPIEGRATAVQPAWATVGGMRKPLTLFGLVILLAVGSCTTTPPVVSAPPRTQAPPPEPSTPQDVPAAPPGKGVAAQSSASGSTSSTPGSTSSTPRSPGTAPGNAGNASVTEKTIAVQETAGNIIGAFGSIWEVSEGNTSELLRIDPRTDKVTGTVNLGYGDTGGDHYYHSGLTQADGSLWISEFWYNQVLRIDPVGLRITGHIDVGRSPLSVLGEGHDVWVADFHSATVSRIDTRTDRVVQTITGVGDPAKFNVGPKGMASVDGIVWVSIDGQHRIYGIDPRTGHVVQTHDVSPAQTCGALSPAPHAVIIDDTRCSNTYSRFDVRTGAVTQVTAPDSSCLFGLAPYPGTAKLPAGLVVTEEARNLGPDNCSQNGNLVARNPVTGAELFRIPVSNIGLELVPIGADLWADGSSAGNILHFIVHFGSGS